MPVAKTRKLAALEATQINITDTHLNIILGPTASGKESSAFIIAQNMKAGIISVDSMKVYRNLDIGTAKASTQMREIIPHYCLDIADPTEDFSVGRFQNAADGGIAQLTRNGKKVILSGGTALYYKAILEGLFDAPVKDETLREKLRDFAAQYGNDALYARLLAQDPKAAKKIHTNDLRRVIRALEIIELTGKPISQKQQQWSGFHNDEERFRTPLRYSFKMVRLDWPREELYRRIELRVDKMLEEGLEGEARYVFDNRDTFSRTPLQAVGYKEFFPYFRHECNLQDAIELLKKNTRHLAKSQLTWFHKFPAQGVALSPGMSANDIASAVQDSLTFAPLTNSFQV